MFLFRVLNLTIRQGPCQGRILLYAGLLGQTWPIERFGLPRGGFDNAFIYYDLNKALTFSVGNRRHGLRAMRPNSPGRPEKKRIGPQAEINGRKATPTGH